VSWDFSTEPEFEAELKWMRGFVREEMDDWRAALPLAAGVQVGRVTR
jgi:acyl-CoA dehydrogenase